MIRTYSELIRFDSFTDRFKYAQLCGVLGEVTFGWRREYNQILYHSAKWKKTRNLVIVRDNGCDLAHPDYELYEKILVHHLNPITIEDVESNSDLVYDPEFLICVSHNTHNAIHYGDESLLPVLPVDRFANDMCPWK